MSTSLARRVRRPLIALTGAAFALSLAAGTAAAAPSAPAGAHCPVSQIAKVWYGGTQDPETYMACGDLAEQIEHLYYPGTMLSTSLASYYREDVVFVQLRLRDLNYRPLAVDGRYGSQTAGAVKRYQRNHGLVVDGKVGPQTWRALFGL